LGIECSESPESQVPPTGKLDRRLMALAAEDNVCVACTRLPAGTSVLVEGMVVTLRQPIELGHKLARRPITPGQSIIKYGARIGSATAPIAPGDHVHTHNMKSDYIPTYTAEDGRRYVEERGA
jgi:altronate dehydratase small subunit